MSTQTKQWIEIWTDCDSSPGEESIIVSLEDEDCSETLRIFKTNQLDEAETWAETWANKEGYNCINTVLKNQERK